MKKNTDNQSTTKYVVEVPNYDNEGNDVSGDHPHAGGRRRKDGTLETSTFNYVPLDDVKEQMRDEVRNEVYAEMEPEHDISDSIDSFNEMLESLLGLVETVAVALEQHPEIVEGLSKGFNTVKNFVQTKFKEGFHKSDKANKEKKPKKPRKGLLQPKIDTIVPAEPIESNTMSRDDAKALFLQMVNDYISFREKYEQLSNAEFVDSSAGLEDFCTKLETVIHDHPELLEDKTRNELMKTLEGFSDEATKRRLLEVISID